MTIKEYSEKVGISYRTACRKIKKGLIKATMKNGKWDIPPSEYAKIKEQAKLKKESDRLDFEIKKLKLEQEQIKTRILKENIIPRKKLVSIFERIKTETCPDCKAYMQGLIDNIS